MAPSQTARPTKSILKRTSSDDASRASETTDGSLFPSSKKDKRRIKHAHLLNKITKSSTTKPRKRRPSKKLVTTLDALADALPTDVGETTGPRAAGWTPEDQVNIIPRKSMKSKPGAMKRKEKLDQSERERFAKNMAQLAAASSQTPNEKTISRRDTVGATEPEAPSSTSERWAALRGFISQTLETKPPVTNVKT